MTRDQTVTFRLSLEELSMIDERKAAQGLSRSEYLIRAGLCQLGSSSADWRETVESRLDRLERLAFNE
jgi:hypothetical protein